MDGNGRADQEQRTDRVDTIVIGAGQAGLAAGYHLARRGVPFVILDADERVGHHWREHWDSLRLYSPAGWDGLPGMRFPAARFHYPSGREMGDYLEAYAAKFALPVVSGTHADSVRRAEGPNGGYVVSVMRDFPLAAMGLVLNVAATGGRSAVKRPRRRLEAIDGGADADSDSRRRNRGARRARAGDRRRAAG